VVVDVDVVVAQVLVDPVVLVVADKDAVPADLVVAVAEALVVEGDNFSL
jgi:hypothetical protein